MESPSIFLPSLTPQEVSSFMKSQLPAVSEDVLTAIINHKIDGEVFLVLNEEYLREISLILGDRIKMKKIISDAQFSTTGHSLVIN